MDAVYRDAMEVFTYEGRCRAIGELQLAQDLFKHVH
jgi:hypothetical protein